MASPNPHPDYELWRQRRAEAFGEAPPAPSEPQAPAEPIPLPGTPGRKQLLHERARQGQELHPGGEVIDAPDQMANYTRLRNGRDVLGRGADTVAIRPEPGEKPATIRDRKTSTQKVYELAFPYLKALGSRLRALRGRRSLGQVALASGVLKETLRKLEAGRTPRPRIDTLLLLADWYRVSLDDLVGRQAR